MSQPDLRLSAFTAQGFVLPRFVSACAWKASQKKTRFVASVTTFQKAKPPEATEGFYQQPTN
jgi:hypothetical protein